MKTIKISSEEALAELQRTKDLFDKFGISGWTAIKAYNSVLMFYSRYGYITQMQRLRLHTWQRRAKSGT